MFEKIADRSFLSPAVAFTFIPVALSGLFLLFHVRFDGIKGIHQWLGLAFIIFCSFHIMVNWRCLLKYFSKREAHVALILTIVLTLTCAVLGGKNRNGSHQFHKGGVIYSEGLHK
ncbi:DUF4405 domain-containing protein [Maridesulfovibrio zosterae]|uniref:DUF4405 domain-containing protein n=1 Tax=Maridesulfovibrio zosterae TaxID=82171 RepID=UPI0003F81D83|nr:DUF4405 domain-containing protein [Maridesulfovibrio zosterae]